MKNKVIPNIIAILIIIIIFMLVCEYKEFDIKYYEKMHELNNITSIINIEFNELISVNQTVIDYIKGNISSMDIISNINNLDTRFFNDKEILHMVDVKGIYTIFNMIKYLMIGLLVVLTIYYFNTKNSVILLVNTFIKNIHNLVIIVMTLTTYILIDFKQFWHQFHLIFFTNDLWLLDPLTDRMIQMYPTNFFSNMILEMGIIYIIIIIVLYISAIIYQRKVRNND